ncbi:MAG: FAD-dependent monooxygenase [Azonexus sp.]|jgi:2-octaprenyl-6-methoxyphenol hydroxylase|nr:FAD-dependent monooxygenase [Azonexus sp.]
MTEAVEEIDILIIGAGPVGLTLHRALAAGGRSSLLIDRQPRQAGLTDPRALALTHGARQLLEQIGCWPAKAATPIETIHIGQKDGFGRTLLDRADYGLPALGYVLRYRDLAAALGAQVAEGSLLDETEVVDVSVADNASDKNDGVRDAPPILPTCQPARRDRPSPLEGEGKRERGAALEGASPLIPISSRGEGSVGGLTVTLRRASQTRRIRCKLLVHAEGAPGDGPDITVADYAQHAVICEVAPAPGHDRRAWERFTPDGPLALLPLGEQYSVVFTLPPAKADAVMALDDAAFIAALQSQFGDRLRLARPGPRHRFPLALRQRRHLAQGREVWIGNAAQTLHPVSGQGFNLGLRDAWQLAETLLNDDPDLANLPATLQRYAARRQLDRRGGAAFTDGVVKIFSNHFPPLKFARGLGLLALDLFPPARHFVAKRMIWGARAWP